MTQPHAQPTPTTTIAIAGHIAGVIAGVVSIHKRTLEVLPPGLVNVL